MLTSWTQIHLFPPNAVQHRLLQQLLEREGPVFQQTTFRWRPTNLLMLQQVRLLLRDITHRYERLSEAEGELSTLDRKHIYITLLRRMRLWIRSASFTWKADQLSFIQVVAAFYTDYGHVLRLLKTDLLRGRLTT